MFRSNRRRDRDNEILRFMEDTNHDMMNMTKNLREEMKLARKLSIRRIDRAALKKAPPAQIQYPHIDDELFLEGSSSLPCALIRRYPTLAEVSKLPSSRYFGQVLDEEFDDTPKKPAAITTTTNKIQEEHLHDDGLCGDDQATTQANVEIEVFPGVFKVLRGSKETQAAWESGLCSQAPCMVCDAELAFVWDCEFVICPDCKAVVPVEATETAGMGESMPSLQSSISSFLSDAETVADLPRRGGVGLGIRIL